MNPEKRVTVSVVLPAYNVASYLPQCIESLLAQTYINLEIIIVDDGSTDGTGQIADDYSQKDTRVRVIHQANSGVSVARNVGLDAVIGQYVAFIDGDDWVDANWVRSQLEVVDCQDADISVCPCERVFQNERLLDCMIPACDVMKDYEDKKKLALGIDEWEQSAYANTFVWKLLVKRECLTDFSTRKPLRFITDRNYCEDLLYVLRVYKNAHKIAFNRNAIYHYRMRESSAASDAKFCFKHQNTWILMRNIGLINELELLRAEILGLYRISLINPKCLDKWEKQIFLQIISNCRDRKSLIYTIKINFLRKIFACIYLLKWPTFQVKNKIMIIVSNYIKLLHRGISVKKRLKYM